MFIGFVGVLFFQEVVRFLRRGVSSLYKIALKLLSGIKDKIRKGNVFSPNRRMYKITLPHCIPHRENCYTENELCVSPLPFHIPVFERHLGFPCSVPK